MIGILTVHLHLPACTSLKQKRGRLRPLLARLHREFNVSAAEMDLQDRWDAALIAWSMVGNESAFIHSALQTVQKWIESNWPDGMVVDQHIELV